MNSANLRNFLFMAGLVFLFRVPANGQESAKDAIAEDEKLLQSVKVPVDGKGLLDFLHRQVPTAKDEKEVEALFRQLDSNSFKDRQQASTALIAMGPKIVPLLKRLLQPGVALEVRRRAEGCILAVQKIASPTVAAAAVRLLKVRKPAKACAGLLEFAPYAPDELVADEVLDALATVGIVKDQADPVLIAALRDQQTLRRQFAALLVGRFGNQDQRKTVAALLDDRDSAVRFRAAQGLVGAGNSDALPILVESLRQAPETLAEHAEEILRQIAGATAPKIRFAAEGRGRDSCHKAWKDWLKVHQSKIDLTKVDVGFPSGNASLRARDVVRQFFEIALKPDPEKLRRLTELPFRMSGQGIITTRKEWDDNLKKQENQKLPDGIKLKFTTGKVLTLPEYLGKAKPGEKEFLEKFPRSQVRVVVVSLAIEFMGQKPPPLTVGVFVRVNGTRARIIGTGEPDAPMMKK